MFKGLLIVAGGAFLGNMLAEKWVLKSGPGDPDGFVEVADGIGADDLARAVTIALSVWLIQKFVR